MSDFWADPTHPKASRPHQCVTCFRVIDKGEVYVKGFGIHYGEVMNWKQCLHCEAMLPYLDYDETYSSDDYECFEPRNIAELRVLVHLRCRWRNKAGTLYPIPFQKVAV